MSAGSGGLHATLPRMVDAAPSAVPAGPVPVAERVPLLDVLRGLALLGVLYANLPLHASGPLLGAGTAYDGADATVVRVIGALFTGKFFVLFSLLFGLGVVLQDQRTRAAGTDLRRRHRRRMVGLMALGVAHGVLLFDGDVLLAYGLLGLLLPRFLHRPARTLVRLATVLVGVGALLSAAVAGLGAVDLQTDLEPGPATLTYLDSLRLRAAGTAVQVPLLLVAGPPVFGMFLVGVAAAQRRWLERDEVLRRWRAALVMGVALAVPGGWVTGAWPLPGTSPAAQVVGVLAVGLGGPLVALGTIGWTAGWLSARPDSRLAAVLRDTGRMSLTCYLGQSLLLQPLLSPWGLDLARGPLWALLPVGAAVYVALALFASAWLRRSRHGPVEWALRSWTYRARQPLRESRPQPAGGTASTADHPSDGRTA